MKNLGSLIFLFLLVSCTDYNCGERYIQPKKVLGWKAVKMFKDTAQKITYEPTAKPTTNAGKIYAMGGFIFQNELGKGIHIIDNSNPANAHKIGFINILGNTDFSFKGNQMLYANSYYDMLQIDLSNYLQPVVIKKIEGAFNAGDEYFWNKPTQSGFYNCSNYYSPDSVIVGWVQDSVYNNECFNP